MRPIIISIPGDYYDSQIYNDRLYLWTTDGDILTLDWGLLIDSLDVEKHQRLAIECAFRRSDYLYGDHWKNFFEDTEIRQVLHKKFQSLESTVFELHVSSLQQYLLGKPRRSPLGFPHADTDIYYNHLITGSDEGIVINRIESSKGRGIGGRAYEYDVPTFDLAPSNYNIALANGGDGVHTISLVDMKNGRLAPNFEDAKAPKKISKKASLEVEWMFSNLLISDNNEEGSIVEFDVPKASQKVSRSERIEKYSDLRKIDEVSVDGIIDISQESLIWGDRDKLCSVVDSHVTVYSYKPWRRVSELDKLSDLDIPIEVKNVESLGSSNFSFNLQSDGILHILQSDGGYYSTGEEVSNWRTFNRSKNYSNQLHAIYDDRIDIISFNGDYFLDQSKKIIGLYHNPSLTDQRSKRREYYI